MIRLFIGYDSNETVSYHVFCQSVMENTSYPVSITPVKLESVESWFNRERQPNQSTEFSFSRFLVPFLSGYEGWSIFADCDFLCRDDIFDLWQMRNDKYDVMVCQHDHRPEEETKFLGNIQTKYRKKNWSSLMLFNNRRCKALTRRFVSSASGLSLHQFEWCESVGALPLEWNHLVGYHGYDPDAKMVHFTHGGPWFKEYENTDYAEEWFKARDRMLYAAQAETAN